MAGWHLTHPYVAAYCAYQVLAVDIVTSQTNVYRTWDLFQVCGGRDGFAE